MSLQHISETLADTAWDRYAQASAQVSRIPSGQQLGLFDTRLAEAREWKRIALACDLEALRHGAR